MEINQPSQGYAGNARESPEYEEVLSFHLQPT